MSFEDRSFKDEIRKFGETVSVRGLSKVFKSQNWFLKVFWLLSVLTGLGILIWQLTAVLVKYSQFQVSTTYAEPKLPPVLPDISICNIYPMTNDISQLLSWSDYLDIINYEVSTYTPEVLNSLFPSKYKSISQDNYDAFVRNYLKAPSGYFSNLPIPTDTGGSAQHLITDCYYFQHSDIPIDCLSGLVPLWNPKYYKCYTLQVPELEGQLVEGLSAVLYLNNFPEELLNFFDYGLSYSLATGVRVAVHKPGSKPDFYNGVSVGPGTETTIRITSTNRTRLPMPYENRDCTKQKYLPYSDNETYSYDGCYGVCMQNAVVKNCNCVESFYAYTRKQLLSVNNIICGNQSLLENHDGFNNNTDWIRQVICSMSILYYDSPSDVCEAMCLLPCSEMYYSTSVYSAPWPHITQQLAFYDEFIRNNTAVYGQDFSYVYEPIYQEMSDVPKTLQRLASVNLIEKNFIQLNVILDKQYQLIDRPAMTWENLLSSIGGCLSLWLGVTVMTFVEVIEFLFTIGITCKKNRKSISTQSIQPNSPENP